MAKRAPDDFFNIEWSGDALERLYQLNDMRGLIDIWIEEAVAECRHTIGDETRWEQVGDETRERRSGGPISWSRIGEALGVSRAAAWERFHE